ncbi:hypothetical protein PBT90_03305 [Algoriphagus halophytocola]|uniref:DUF4468 domain-containing protein n=1 Tax=Algoriphagus halophytocola TaxID=2991499 RepID=A0ABY6MF66_9BACT|nr:MULTISPECIES: hypothetical protein [unclassified Algoriphagus]UZD22455.1 hypothetical protein OM944_17585 [Algoriphagus sp. TR-M5]WBL43715.1 hypothetical protein PBT90_03305 [Algoriphagus sp. TR-M9]
MKNLLTITVFLISMGSYAQSSSGWSTPVLEIPYQSESESPVSLKIDKGFMYADFTHSAEKVRIFYNKDIQNIHQVRIVDSQSNELIARGRGSYFFGTARFVFADGEVMKVKRKKNPNGYDIIGPYGTLFKVENQGISPTKTYNEKDLILQAYYVFDRIKTTQTPTEEIYQNFSSLNTSTYQGN